MSNRIDGIVPGSEGGRKDALHDAPRDRGSHGERAERPASKADQMIALINDRVRGNTPRR